MKRSPTYGLVGWRTDRTVCATYYPSEYLHQETS